MAEDKTIIQISIRFVFFNKQKEIRVACIITGVRKTPVSDRIGDFFERFGNILTEDIATIIN